MQSSPSYTPITALCARATPETLRRNTLLAPYAPAFFEVARRSGTSHARAWLLGRFLLDQHTDPHPTALPLQQDLQLPPPNPQPSSRTPRERLQQHIESAASIHSAHVQGICH